MHFLTLFSIHDGSVLDGGEARFRHSAPALLISLLAVALVSLSIDVARGELPEGTPVGTPAGTPGVTPGVTIPRVGELSIGIMIPTEGSERDRGEVFRAGATLAVENINREDGVNGSRLRLRVEDYGVDGRSQLAAFSNLVPDRDIPVVITAGESEAALVKGIAQLNQVLILTNSMRETPIKGNEYVVRIGRSLVAAQQSLIELVRQRQVSRISVITGDVLGPDEATAQLALSMSPNSGRSGLGAGLGAGSESPIGGKVVNSVRLWDVTGKPIPQAIANLKRAKPELVYLALSEDEQGRALRILADAGFNSPMVSLFGCGWASRSVVSGKTPSTLYSIDPSSGAVNARYDDMAQKFADRFPKIPLTFDAMVAYDTVYMVADAYRKGKGTGEAIRDYLFATKIVEGAAGRLEMTAGGDSIRPTEVNRIVDGACSRLSLSEE